MRFSKTPAIGGAIVPPFLFFLIALRLEWLTQKELRQQ